MTSRESTQNWGMQTWAGTAEAGPAQAVGTVPDNRVSPGAAEYGAADRMRRAAAVDNALTAPDWSCGDVMSGALTHAMDLSDVRLEEVLRLRAAIASGCYRVSSAALADKLIACFTGDAGAGGRDLDKRN